MGGAEGQPPCGPAELPESVWSRILEILWANNTAPHSRLVCTAWARFGEKFAPKLSPSSAARAASWTSRWTGCRSVGFERVGSLVQDADIEALTTLPNLSTLALRRPVRISPAGFPPLRNQLRALTVNMLFGAYPRGGAPGFFQAISTLTRLTTLRLQLLEDPQLASIGMLPHLKHLDLTGSKPLRDTDVEWMSTLPTLHSIDLTKCGHLGNLSVLGALAELRAIDLRDCVFDIGHIARLTSLRVICLRRCTWGDDGQEAPGGGLDVIAALRQLQSLDIAGCPITVSQLETIGTLTTLRRLVLAGCANIRDEHVQLLCGQLKGLRFLDLSWNSQLSQGCTDGVGHEICVQADGCSWYPEQRQGSAGDVTEGLSSLSLYVGSTCR